MRHDEMPATFVRYAADVLGDTAGGLSGSQIVSVTAAHAVDCDARLPHSSIPFSKPGINKRTALYENLMALPLKNRYKAIKDMCGRSDFAPGHIAAVRTLKLKLVTKHGHLDDEGSSDAIDETLVEQTRHWLEEFPEALKLFNEALEKQGHGVFRRNLLDDLRLALEKLLQGLLANGKSLENQSGTLGAFLKEKGGSPELTNMFMKLLDYYAKYQNTHVKHDDAVVEEEIEFLFEITASFMKHLIRLNAQ